MDTTAAAELGMLADAGGVDGVGFWDSGDVDPSSWGGEEEEEEDDAEEDFMWERAAAVVASQAAAQGPPGRQQRQSSSSAGMEPPSKKRSKPAPPDEASPGAGGKGSGSNSGKGNSQHVGGGQGFGPAGGAVVVGAGAVGRGRGTGSIFYKTKLCSRFRSGNCPYNTNCNFAHGMEELRKPPPGWEEFVASQELPPAMPASQSPSHGGSGGGAAGGGGGSTDSQVRFHKTRPCKKYFGEGNCPYGEKCNFLHDEQSAPRAVREARETAAPLLSTPKTESSSLSAEGPAKDALASNSAATASAAAGSITPRPLNWKTRLCNKWETTGQCPFGDKCHFAHGSDELQMYGGGPLDPNAPAPTISDSGGSPNKSPSETGTDSSILYNDAGPHQRQLNAGASQQNSSRGFSGGGLKAFTNWKGPTDISTIYGDWIDEEEEWEHDSRGDQESLGAESNAKSVEQLPLPHQQQNVAFFRGGNGRHISRQSNNIQTHGFSSSAKNGGAGHVTGLLGVEPG